MDTSSRVIPIFEKHEFTEQKNPKFENKSGRLVAPRRPYELLSSQLEDVNVAISNLLISLEEWIIGSTEMESNAETSLRIMPCAFANAIWGLTEELKGANSERSAEKLTINTFMVSEVATLACELDEALRLLYVFSQADMNRRSYTTNDFHSPTIQGEQHSPTIQGEEHNLLAFSQKSRPTKLRVAFGKKEVSEFTIATGNKLHNVPLRGQEESSMQRGSSLLANPSPRRSSYKEDNLLFEEEIISSLPERSPSPFLSSDEEEDEWSGRNPPPGSAQNSPASDDGENSETGGILFLKRGS